MTETPPPEKSLSVDLSIGDMLTRISTEARELHAVVHEDNIQRRKESRRVMTVGAALLVMVLLLLLIVVQNRQRSEQSRQILRNSAATSQQIADCTTPGRACYETNQRRTSEIVGQLVRSNIYIAQCQRVSDTDAELEKCVQDRLSQPAAKPSPSTSAGK